MSDTLQAQSQEDLAIKGRGILVSYNELVQIRVGMQELKTMLQTTLALKGTVDDHTLRITALEQGRLIANAKSGVWYSILAFAAGLVTSALGGGALAILPKLWGG